MVRGIGRVWAAVLVLGLLGASLLGASGAAAYEEGGGGDNPPYIAAGELSPSSLSWEGGSVQIRAEIIDDRGLYMTYAQIYRPDASSETIQIFEGYKDNYFTTLEVPPNYSDVPVEYGVEIQAWDSNGAYSATLIGSVQVEAAPQFDEPPYVTGAELNPSFLPSEGGTVTISADAGDNGGIAGLFATVSLPGGDSVEVPMNATSSSHFEGTYEVPANTGPLAAEYPVEVVAQDGLGQQGRASAGAITVAPPPPPPSSGQLEIQAGDRSFGTVKLGRTAQRQVVVRNLPGKGGEPVAATAVVYGSDAFSIAGASSTIHFVLQPGERKTITVQFAPTAPGEQYGALELIRDDGAQPGLAVQLSGRTLP